VKLHTTDVRPIQRYLAGRRQEENVTISGPLAALKVDMAAEGGLHILRREDLGKPVRIKAATTVSRPVKGGRGLLERKRAVQRNNKDRPHEESDSSKAEMANKQEFKVKNRPEGKEHIRPNEKEAGKSEAKEAALPVAEVHKTARKASREKSKVGLSISSAKIETTEKESRLSGAEEQKNNPLQVEENFSATNEITDQSFNVVSDALVKPGSQLDNITKNRVKPPRVSKKTSSMVTVKTVETATKTADHIESKEESKQQVMSKENAVELTAKKEIKSILVKNRAGSSQTKPVGRRVSLEEETVTVSASHDVNRNESAASTSRSMEIDVTEDEEEDEEDSDDDDASDDDDDDDSEDDESDEDEETTTAQSSTTTGTTTEATTHIDTEDSSSAVAKTTNPRVVIANVERSDVTTDSDGVVIAEQKASTRKGARKHCSKSFFFQHSICIGGHVKEIK
jgi:hypothetical protein